MIYFTSDPHFHHSRVIEYSNRPFSSVEEMNEILIENYNSIVGPQDTCYILGDVAFCKQDEARKIVSRLKGHKILVSGNHDYRIRWHQLGVFQRVVNYLEIKEQKESMILFHYPMLVWNRHHYGSWHLHGHSHGSLINRAPEYYKRKVLDVGVDVHNYMPISFDQVREIMNSRERCR